MIYVIARYKDRNGVLTMQSRTLSASMGDPKWIVTQHREIPFVLAPFQVRSDSINWTSVGPGILYEIPWELDKNTS